MVANAAAEVNVNLRVIRALAASAAPLAAARAIANQHERTVKLILTRKTHPAGTRTPSRPGEPPALISGNLRRSVTHITASYGAGTAVAVVWPDAMYASIQEVGGTITAHNFPQLGNPTVGFFGPAVTLPKRPYMALALAEALAAGTLGSAAAAAFGLALGF